jgi:PAS domain S-box-containing protein
MSEISKGRRIIRAALRVPLARGTLSIKIMPSELRPRLVALVGLMIGVCVFVSACFQEHQATQIALDEVIANATDTARAYAEEAAAEFSDGSFPDWSRDVSVAVKTKGITAMRVIDRHGHTVAEAFDAGQEDAWNGSPLVRPDTSSQPRVLVMYVPTLRAFGIGLFQHPARVDVSYPIANPFMGRVLLSHSTSTIDHARSETVSLAVTSGMLTLGACVLAMILVIRRPLRELETATRFVSGLHRHFGNTLPVATSTSELQQLTSAINWASTTLYDQQYALQGSEAQKRELLDTLQEVVFETDQEGRWVYLNRAWTQVTGYDVGESLNQSCHKHVLLEDLAQVRQLFIDILSGQRGDSRHTVRFITKHGGVRWLEAYVRASRDERDQIDGIIGTLSDVTGQQTVERKLRDQLQFIEQLLDAIPVATYYRSNDGRFLGVNQAHTELFGCSRQDCLGKTAEEAMPPELAKAHPPLVTASAEAVQTHETQVTSADNRTRHLICIQAPFHSSDGMVAGVIGVFSDITERKEAEQAIADAGLFLNRTIDAVPTPIVVTDTAGRVVLVNDAWLQLSGIERSTALGKRSRELDGVARQISATQIRAADSVPAKGLESELTVVDNAQEARRLMRRTSELRLPGDSVMQINVISDITEISRAKVDLERQLRFVSELVEALPLPVLVKDRSGRYVLINRAAELFFERPRAELLRMGPEASQPVDRVRESYETDKRVLVGAPVCYEAPYFSRNGTRRDMVVTKTAFTDPDTSVAGIISTFVDITERRQIERSLNVQYEIVRILTDATSVPDAVRQIMRVVGTALGYGVGTFWQVHPSGEYLKCEDFWCADQRDSARLGAITQNLHVRKGFSLPGRIWASARPERKMHAPATSSFGQIGTGFGFPIKIGPDVVAVMQFLVGTGAEIDADVIAMLNAAGSQIGQFIERQRIHDSFRASEAAARKLSLVASHTANAVVIMDTDGRIDWVNRAFVEMTGYVLEEVNGMRFEELLHGPDTDRATIEFIIECMKEQRDLKAEILQYRKSNESYWINLEIQPVFSGSTSSPTTWRSRPISPIAG